jgi:ketosteroid isomerase-like protein
MTLKHVAVVGVLGFVAPVILAGQQAAQTPAKGPETQLIELDKQFSAAVLKSDRAALEKLLATNFRQTDHNGRVSDRAQVLTVAKAGAKAAQFTADDYSAHVSGSTAVVTHRSTDESDRQQYRNTHVWTKTGAAWRLSVSTTTSIREGANAPAVLDCSTASFEAEVFQFYGDATTIVSKLAGDRIDVAQRRAYMLLLESDAAAELAFFERNPSDGKLMQVAQWQGTSVADVREELTRALLANRGIACTGEQAKRLLQSKYHIQTAAMIDSPYTAQGAFSHLIKRHGPTYMRATVLLFC